MHQRVDSAEPETRRGVRFERAVLVEARQLGLTGKLDLLEIEKSTGRYIPVEYKSGKVKTEDWDNIQVCAQALCLEEMLGISITEAALWYWKTRSRVTVLLNTELRSATLNTIESVHHMFDSLHTPHTPASPEKCKACSLQELCQPDLIRKDKSKAYWDNLFIQ